MNVTLQQAAKILSKTPDEVMYLVQDGRLTSQYQSDPQIEYLADGRVEIKDEQVQPVEWLFDFDDVLNCKQNLEDGLDGQVRQLLEG